MNLGSSVPLYLYALLLTAASAAAQPAPDTTDLSEVLWVLEDRYEHRVLIEASSGDYEGMRLVDSQYGGMPAAWRYAVLSYEQRHIARILRATLTSTYTVAPLAPGDPYQDTPWPHTYTTRLVSQNARILDHDAMRCWKERDYDGALRRVAGIIRLAHLLADSGDDISPLMGSGLLDMACNRLGAIVEASESADKPPTFSRSAVEEVRVELATRDPYDADGYAETLAGSTRRRLTWMRDTFLHDDGAIRYRDYIARHGETESEMLLRDAIIHTTFDQALREVAHEGGGLPEWKRRAQELWDALDPDQQEAAMAVSRERFRDGDPAWPGNTPILYPNEPSQSPSREDLVILFDQIESIIDELAAADTRQDIRRVLTQLNTAIVQDRSQATRIATQLSGTVSLTCWTASIRRHDESLAALDALKEFTADD